MGEARAEGETWFERFQTLLESMGVQVDFVPDAASTGVSDGAEDAHEDERPVARKSALRKTKEESRTSLRPRRVSFDSAYETIGDSRVVSGIELPEPSSRPHSTDIDRRVQRHRISNTHPMNSLRSAAPRAGGDHKSRVYVEYVNANRVIHTDSRRAIASRRSRSKDHDRPLHVRLSKTFSAASGSEASDEDSGEDFTSESHQYPNQLHYERQTEEEPQAAIVQMDGHARTLRYHHLAATALNLYRNWRHKTRQVLLERQQRERETEAFFAVLEAKATKARDMFLLAKAFSHWAQSASEEVQRTDAARKHLLQTRYFNACLDVTVVNELKVRRQVLQKFIDCWKRRTAQVLYQHNQAVMYHDRKTFDRFYKHWFWHFCERRAPAWYASKLKAGIFAKWVDLAKQAQITKQWAFDFRALELIRTTTGLWAGRTKVIADNHNQAELFRRRKLLQPAVDTLQKELELAPISARVVRAIDGRIVHTVLVGWLARARLTIQAGQVDRQRILRNAWTAWNDRLRSKTLIQKIDDRILLQTLYKWVLMERQALCTRVINEKLKHSFLQRWRTRTNDLSESLGRANHQVHEYLTTRSQTTVFTTWTAKTHAQQAQNEIADNFRSHYLRTTCLTLWTTKYRQLQSLDATCTIARFYILTKTPLKRWQAAAAASQRTRRRDAYATVRRRMKEALARKCLAQWRNATVDRVEMSVEAAEFEHDRAARLAASLLAHWASRTASVADLTATAEAFDGSRLLGAYFAALLSRYDQVTALHSNADAFLAGVTATHASTCLRKLNWHLFQSKRRDETAESLASRNQRRHVKGMVRYWKEQALQRRNQQLVHEELPVGDVEDVNRTPAPVAASTPRFTFTTAQRTRFRTATIAASSTALVNGVTRQTDDFASVAPQSPLPAHSAPPMTASAATPAPATTTPFPATPAYLRSPARRALFTTTTRARTSASSSANTLLPTTPGPATSAFARDKALGNSTFAHSTSTPLPRASVAGLRYSYASSRGISNLRNGIFASTSAIGTGEGRGVRGGVSNASSSIAEEDEDGEQDAEEVGRGGGSASPSPAGRRL